MTKRIHSTIEFQTLSAKTLVFISYALLELLNVLFGGLALLIQIWPCHHLLEGALDAGWVSWKREEGE